MWWWFETEPWMILIIWYSKSSQKIIEFIYRNELYYKIAVHFLNMWWPPLVGMYLFITRPYLLDSLRRSVDGKRPHLKKSHLVGWDLRLNLSNAGK